MDEREIYRAFEGMETMDGAGVRLIPPFQQSRGQGCSIPSSSSTSSDSDDPDLSFRAFPRTPHRGIDVEPNMLSGTVR